MTAKKITKFLLLYLLSPMWGCMPSSDKVTDVTAQKTPLRNNLDESQSATLAASVLPSPANSESPTPIVGGIVPKPSGTCAPDQVDARKLFSESDACTNYVEFYTKCTCKTGDILSGSLCVATIQNIVAGMACFPAGSTVTEESLNSFCVSTLENYKKAVEEKTPGRCR